MHNASAMAAGRSEIAYLLKAFPRASETFIASEIHRLEQLGVPLRLFVIKPAESWDREPRHPVVDRIHAQPEFLAPTTSLQTTTLARWTAVNATTYLPAVCRVAIRHPVGLARAATAAAAQAWRTRRAGLPNESRMVAKELVQAVLLADRLRRAPAVRHLHAHSCHGTATVAWLASLIRGVPFSFTAHARDIYSEALNPAGLLGRKLRAARFAVTCTDANRRHLQQVEPRAAVHRVYHGLNADLTRMLTQPMPMPAAPVIPRIIGVGRLVPKKGFDVLVRACAILNRTGHGIEAVIAGPDGDGADAVRTRVSAEGLQSIVRLPGALSQAALLAEYRRALAFCLPCRVVSDGDRDGIPNVLVEAMACGLPVIATPVSGIPELIEDGVNGLLVPPDDPRALADAILRLHEDRPLAARLGLAGQATVRERFDGDVLASELAALFRKVAA